MTIDGIIVTQNSNDNFINLVVKNAFGTMYNIKTSKEVAAKLKPNHVYEFVVKEENTANRTKYLLEAVLDISKDDTAKRDVILRNFLPHKDLTFAEAKTKLFNFIALIDNQVLHDVTKILIERNLVDFLTYPGGTRIHHNFLGGLVYHTLGMLELAEATLKIYSYLDKNYLFSGIILHDLGKLREFNDVQNPEFSLDGQMLGHLVMGALAVAEVAKELNYSNREEILVLEHILISHHGQLQYGSAKKPLTAEALLIWYLDTIDSKFQVIGDELAKVAAGEFTDSIPVLERMRLYKPKRGE